jgi:CheY-like chemotaxis protein
MAKILIVDDEPTIRELFRYVFEEAGHEVAQAENGRAAFDRLSEGLPDFIILDIAMPEMSGKEFVLELGRRAVRDPRLSRIPFVVMTGEDLMEMELNRVFAASPGFVCFFPKMIPPEMVLEKTLEVLGGGAV